MPHDYVISARKIEKGNFVAEPGPVRYLRVPSNASAALPAYATAGAGDLGLWIDEVIGLADGDENPNSISLRGDILVFVHGYNNSPETILWRQRRLNEDLKAEGWRGVVIGFDWPCEEKPLNYLEDRKDAAAVALQLVRSCVKHIMKAQNHGCETNIHLIGHSTGAYVIMEAFAQAEKDGELFKSPWRIGQVAFIGADVAAHALSSGDDWAAPMFRRIMRLTNYTNPYDSALGISNAKRLGTAPRVGRAGAPLDPDPKVADVDCGPYFSSLNPANAIFAKDANFTHSWHVGDRVFARDLAMTLEGAIDRRAISTRRIEGGRLTLCNEPRPPYMHAWNIRGVTGGSSPPSS
ncbi:MAG: alpha/beta fold hydrolase [Roseomonas sp.]|nr:alpha/beta fold hydrolase [Roseomonas sp.]MCA3380410.1 alpha/beta fold hydrolase [Roseomonas sp.]